MCSRQMFGLLGSLVAIATVSIVLFTPATARADAVNGEVFSYRQPDGTKIDVRLWGDEFYHIVESLDGYTLTREEKTGAACYARVSEDGNKLISTGIRAEKPVPVSLEGMRHLRLNKSAVLAEVATARARMDEDKAIVMAGRGGVAALAPPNNGNVQGITLLVDFSDQPGTISPSEINDYCNQVGYNGYGNNGSIRDYFYDVSDGNLTYTNFVPTAYYRAPQTKAYYDNSAIACCGRARSMVQNALTDLDNQGFDFSQYDSDGDGLVDAVNVFYAGTRNGPWSYGLWPHSGWLSFNADGVSTGRYQITDIGSTLRLRTFCHENGHMICYWPDLYDYGYDSTGVGTFCLMCYGNSSTNPGEPSAYMKYIAGWTDTTILSAPQTGLLAPSGVNTIYKYERPSHPNEYYLLENRQKTGRDASLSDSGLAIWHIDTYGDNDWQQMTPSQHYLVTLVQADGLWDFENDRNYGDADDLWAAPTYTECGPDTVPNTSWWDGSDSELSISQISASAPTMSFAFGVGSDCNGNGTPDDQDIAAGTSQDTNGNSIPDECECAIIPGAVTAESPTMQKSRAITFAPGNPGRQTAIRVTVVDLPPPNDGLIGTSMWVGLPQTVSENSGVVDPALAPGSPTYLTATLQCEPYYTDWSGTGTIHLAHEILAPDGIFDIETIDMTCFSGAETSYSDALAVTTSRWGDIVKDCTTSPCGPPDGVVSVPMDVTSLLDKFSNAPGAPSKSRCDFAPQVPDRIVNITEVSHAVDAFRGMPYPFGVIGDPCGP